MKHGNYAALLVFSIPVLPSAAIAGEHNQVHDLTERPGEYVCFFEKDAAIKGGIDDAARKALRGREAKLLYTFDTAVRGFGFAADLQTAAQTQTNGVDLERCEQLSDEPSRTSGQANASEVADAAPLNAGMSGGNGLGTPQADSTSTARTHIYVDAIDLFDDYDLMHTIKVVLQERDDGTASVTLTIKDPQYDDGTQMSGGLPPGGRFTPLGRQVTRTETREVVRESGSASFTLGVNINIRTREI